MKKDVLAFHRNKQPMLELLQSVLPKKPCDVIEIASGSGQHGPFFTKHIENLMWYPTDSDPQAIQSINSWREHLAAFKVQPANLVDVTGKNWMTGELINELPEHTDVILSMNMVHIAPYNATHGLFAGAGKRLQQGGLLILYGPFKQHHISLAPSNQSFDQSLRKRNPEWGIRQLEDIEKIADNNGLFLKKVVEMPANNLSAIFTIDIQAG